MYQILIEVEFLGVWVWRHDLYRLKRLSGNLCSTRGQGGGPQDVNLRRMGCVEGRVRGRTGRASGSNPAGYSRPQWQLWLPFR